jgi:CheY-like chemotaxis protein
VNVGLEMRERQGPCQDFVIRGKSANPAREKRRRTVLIVDDEPLIADTLAEILNDNGFAAIPIHDGEAAIAQAFDHHPDILITDVVMEGMNGIEVAKAVKSFSPKTRIVLLSGQAETRDLMERAQQEGHSFELWAKPIHPDVLLQRLNQERG